MNSFVQYSNLQNKGTSVSWLSFYSRLNLDTAIALLCINFLEVSQADLLNCGYSSPAWGFMNKLC